MQTECDFDDGYEQTPETPEFVAHINRLRVIDRARMALLRLAVSDRTLKARAKLVLLAVAEACDPLSQSSRLTTADLEHMTGLPVLSIARAVGELRRAGYLAVEPGPVYRLLHIRVVSPALPPGVRRWEE
jgi:CRP-like cAMP-binding protein